MFTPAIQCCVILVSYPMHSFEMFHVHSCNTMLWHLGVVSDALIWDVPCSLLQYNVVASWCRIRCTHLRCSMFTPAIQCCGILVSYPMHSFEMFHVHSCNTMLWHLGVVSDALIWDVPCSLLQYNVVSSWCRIRCTHLRCSMFTPAIQCCVILVSYPMHSFEMFHVHSGYGSEGHRHGDTFTHKPTTHRDHVAAAVVGRWTLGIGHCELSGKPRSLLFQHGFILVG